MLAKIAPHDDETFRTICRKNNWRCTVQRRAVFSCLCGNHDHPSVEAVWRLVKVKHPDVSLDSVYRILDDFTEAGLVRRLESAKAVRYDAETGAHDHFICSECGSMRDFAFLRTDEVADFCRDMGHVLAVDLSVRGVCHACRKKRS